MARNRVIYWQFANRNCYMDQRLCSLCER